MFQIYIDHYAVPAPSFSLFRFFFLQSHKSFTLCRKDRTGARLPFMDMTSDLTMKSVSGITCLETQFCEGRATTLTCFSLTMVTNCRSHDTCDCCWSCATPEPPTPPGLLDTLSELPVSAGDMRFSPLEFLVGVSATRSDYYCNNYIVIIVMANRKKENPKRSLYERVYRSGWAGSRDDLMITRQSSAVV